MSIRSLMCTLGLAASLLSGCGSNAPEGEAIVIPNASVSKIDKSTLQIVGEGVTVQTQSFDATMVNSFAPVKQRWCCTGCHMDTSICDLCVTC